MDRGGGVGERERGALEWGGGVGEREEAGERVRGG